MAWFDRTLEHGQRGAKPYASALTLCAVLMAVGIVTGCRHPAAEEHDATALWLRDLGRRFRLQTISDRELRTATLDQAVARGVTGAVAERYLMAEAHDVRLGAALCIDVEERLGFQGLIALRELERQVPLLYAEHAYSSGRPWTGIPAPFRESWAFGERMWVTASPPGPSAPDHNTWEKLNWYSDRNDPQPELLKDCLRLLRRAKSDGKSDAIRVALLESRVVSMLEIGDGKSDCRARAREWRAALGMPPPGSESILADPILMLAVAQEADGLARLATELLGAAPMRMRSETEHVEEPSDEPRDDAQGQEGRRTTTVTLSHALVNWRTALELAVEYPIPYPWACFSSDVAGAARQVLDTADPVRVALAMDMWPALRSQELIKKALCGMDARGWEEWLQCWTSGTNIGEVGVPCTGSWLACAEVSVPGDLVIAGRRMMGTESSRVRELGRALLTALGYDAGSAPEDGGEVCGDQEYEWMSTLTRVGFSSSWGEPEFEGRRDLTAAIRFARQKMVAGVELPMDVGEVASRGPGGKEVRRVGHRGNALGIVEYVPEFWPSVLDSSPLAWGADRDIWLAAALRSRHLGYQPALIRSWEALARRSGVDMDSGSWWICGSESQWALGAIWDVRWKWRLEHGIPESMAWSWIANCYVLAAPMEIEEAGRR